MADPIYLAFPEHPPKLGIPDSSSSVDVRIIDTTSYGKVSTALVFNPSIPNYDTFTFPSYAFLVSNNGQNKHVLFDMGMRKDWATTLPPSSVEFVQRHMPFTIEANIDEIIDADPGGLGITTKSISTVIWSHHHFDHRGDLAAFPSTTELVVGPGFTKAYLPGYPTNPQSPVLESELDSRLLRELDSRAFPLTIGTLPAHDFFGDGSFYLLSTPGHTVGHLCALARVSTATNPSFVFMGGDCAHYPGIFRPTEYLPLPKEIPAVPGSRFGVASCPGAWLQDYVHPRRSATIPLLTANHGVNENQEDAACSVSAMQLFDASNDVLVCIAHDAGLLGNIDFYPDKLNEWKYQRRKEAVRWNFCGDFDVKTAKMRSQLMN